MPSAGDRPRQTAPRRPHQPPVWRGADGTPAARCAAHFAMRRTSIPRMPGHPEWHRRAALDRGGRASTLAEICAQIKDRPA